MSGEPEQEYFADGMVEEIITALSRIRWLRVIPRASSFTYKRDDMTDPHPFRYLVACYAQIGRHEDARAIGDTPNPNLSHLRNVAHRTLYETGLQMAYGAVSDTALAHAPGPTASTPTRQPPGQLA